MNVLIIEDEKSLANEIELFLKKEGFICDTAYNGKDASEKIFVNEYDFILLDLGLPDYDGLTLLQESRNSVHETAFIIITARGAVDDRIIGLNMGADDYLSKPFSLLELLSRMQAIIRRKHNFKKNTIALHEFTIDLQNRVVTFKKNNISFTKKEFDIFMYLALHKNRVLTRYQLTEHIWGNTLEDVDSNYVDVHIKNIRKKLSQYSKTDWLETIRGIGYKVNSE